MRRLANPEPSLTLTPTLTPTPTLTLTLTLTKFVDVVHLLKFDESGAFRSTRCSDGEELHGNLMP